MAGRTITYAEAIKEALDEELTRDATVYLLGEDIGVWGNLFGCSKGLLEKWGPDRVKDTPISEAGFMGCAIGSAAAGLRPVVEIMYIDFMSIAADQIINHAARWHQLSEGKVRVPVTIRTQQGVGFRNSSQHSQTLESWFVNIPGLIVATPATPYDVKGILKSAIRNDNPVMCIEHKALYRSRGPVPVEDYLIPIGEADVKRRGTDLTIVANSWMVLHALEAADRLDTAGISVEVVDPITLYPLDHEKIVASVRKTGRCLVVNEAPAECGFSAEVTAVVAERCHGDLRSPLRRLTGMRTGIPYDKVLERAVVPGVDQIIQAATQLTKE